MTTCSIENVTADGEVCGSVSIVNGKLIAGDWREIHLTQYYCECGEYFNEDELVDHLNIQLELAV